MDGIVTWLVRWLHVMGAAFWVGGYLVMAFAIIPHLAHAPNDSLKRTALLVTRSLSYAALLTIAAGLLLIARTRGYGQLFGGEWGGIVISSAVLAVVMAGIGDSGMRPALRRIEPGSEAGVDTARRWAILGLLAGVLALGFMTRAIYAR